MTELSRRTVIAGIAASSALAATPALAAFPDRLIKIVVPFPAGGTTDIIARILSAKMPQMLGQTVVVENKGGGGGTIGAAETARAAPDGYSLGIATVSTVATAPAIQPKTPYNPLTDFTPIINVAATPNVISVHPSFPAKDYAGFLAEIKKNPGKYTYATPGIGSIMHLQTELFCSATDTKLTHVPYRGAGPALNDAIAGHVSMMSDNLPSSQPFFADGKLIPIVVSAPQRVASAPNVPTFAEVGLPIVNRVAFYGVVGPKGLPDDVTKKLHEVIKKTLEDADIRKRIEETGSLVIANTPAEFAQQIKEEFEVYKKVVQDRNLKPEQ
ncbi:tripartite tricarboxylate transporter family receptor [Variibacter gotjawalensis]|uniref:Tripartite tricarboxylate transporter family receptor n=1 Tax=Variibacter gotjawalensis TaxID=1333996 RepID=A0A0S3PNU0_9BRAD|nr:tripartite tricarboxylate transporter substrate binding protein BugE [Variibacter gotjawalensis]NIK47927.1 tripartite-type tricarboxylate transporter receptor subunit TctC [Variibacter gotjawalensis]RZS49805.1 tripartite-type tricarboxylate transporter receptor subunit TctC [Variibacter gotjawalensis]BAT57634.1 tripartite tricarboxylate transporter family receptor [Variibacter gotjawalensis]